MRVRTDATMHDSRTHRVRTQASARSATYPLARQRGHLAGKLDPLALNDRDDVPDLTLSFHELTAEDLDTTFQVGTVYFGRAEATLAQIRSDLESTYCAQGLTSDLYTIVDTEERHWIMSRMEAVRSAPEFSSQQRLVLLRQLNGAEGLERSWAQNIRVPSDSDSREERVWCQ